MPRRTCASLGSGVKHRIVSKIKEKTDQRKCHPKLLYINPPSARRRVDLGGRSGGKTQLASARRG
jgi:hypothetical protein